MTWGEFQKERTLYMRAWEALKGSFSGPIRIFLEQSRLVVACGRTFGIEADFSAALKACPAFFLKVPEIAADLKDPAALEISDGWRIEIKFPYVDIDHIQEVKASPYCDKEKTLMRPSSMVVVILKQPSNGKSSNPL